MSDATEGVRALQERARTGPTGAPPRPRRWSRAADLELIDILSRRSAIALAIIAGAGVYLAIVGGRAYPGRAALWAAILAGAVWIARRIRRRFRDGEKAAAHPFRWRSDYASSLAVVGVAFASASALLAPTGAPAAMQLEIMTVSALSGFAAALAVSAHAPSLAAFAAPTIVFALLGAVRTFGVSEIVVTGMISALGAVMLWAFHRLVSRAVLRRNPRTTFARRALFDAGADNVIESPRSASA